jgi:hypothetical protein
MSASEGRADVVCQELSGPFIARLGYEINSLALWILSPLTASLSQEGVSAWNAGFLA